MGYSLSGQSDNLMLYIGLRAPVNRRWIRVPTFFIRSIDDGINAEEVKKTGPAGQTENFAHIGHTRSVDQIRIKVMHFNYRHHNGEKCRDDQAHYPESRFPVPGIKGVADAGSWDEPEFGDIKQDE